MLDLGGREDGTSLGAAARIADASGEIADNQHNHVAGVLKLPQLLQNDRVPEVDVGRGRVDAELHPQRSSQVELALKIAGGQGVDRVALEPCGERLCARSIPAPARGIARGMHLRQC